MKINLDRIRAQNYNTNFRKKHVIEDIIIYQALKGIPRQAYYIATKVGRYELDYDNMFDFTAKRVRDSLKKSLELLELDYVDVIQVNFINKPQ